MGELHTVTDISHHSSTTIQDILADIGNSLVVRDTSVADIGLSVVGIGISAVDINISVADIDPYMAEIDKLEEDIGTSMVGRNTTAADTEEEVIEVVTIADKNSNAALPYEKPEYITSSHDHVCAWPVNRIGVICRIHLARLNTNERKSNAITGSNIFILSQPDRNDPIQQIFIS